VIVIALGINMLVAVPGYYLIIAWGCCSVANQPAFGVHLEEALGTSKDHKGSMIAPLLRRGWTREVPNAVPPWRAKARRK
jgi:hypothetical protein